MNNNNLINIIEKYGGNDDTSIYTDSLLNKYKQINFDYTYKKKNLLEHSIYTNNSNIVKLILKTEAIKYINRYSHSLLIDGINTKNIEIVNLLLKNGLKCYIKMKEIGIN